MKKLFVLVLTLLLALPLCLGGCSGGDKPAETTPAPENPSDTTAALPPAEDLVLFDGAASDFVIVRGDDSSKAETEAAVMLRKYLAACGINVRITTDWKGNGVSEHEIVVGRTLRTAEQGNVFDPHSVGEEGCYALVSGTRIYLGGGSDAAVAAGVEAFMTDFLGFKGDVNEAEKITEKIVVPGDYANVQKQQFALGPITLNGTDLNEYKLVVASKDNKARANAEAIRDSLYALSGTWMELVGKNETYSGKSVILSDETPSRKGFFEASVSGDNLILKTDVGGGFARGWSRLSDKELSGKTGAVAWNGSFSFAEDIGSYVTYREFGARGDGKTNDIAAIIATHDYANANGLEVRGDEGATYYIGAADNGATVRTNVDWTGCSFIIDDSIVGIDKRTVNIFNVRSTLAQVSLGGKISSIKAGADNLGITLDADSIVVLTNSNVKQYIREGANQNNGSDQTDIIVVAKDGTIDQSAPIIWDYDTVTSAYAIPMDAETLTIKGGTFTTIANQAESAYNYYGRGINIQRSNVTVDGLVHYVEGEGKHGAPYSGILSISNCANITLQNCTFTAHYIYQTIGAAGTSVSMGSYDISPGRVVNLTIRDCTQTTNILDTKYWGIMGSNFCKNITLENCNFSRFDAHQGVANVTIRGCTLGWQCLNAIGYGTILVEDTTLYGNSLINLRADYGSTWHGDAIIRNCTWKPNYGGTLSGTYSVIGGSYSGTHYFGYECYMPTNITIENLHVEDKKHTSGYKGIYLLGNITSGFTGEGYYRKLEKAGYTYYPYHVPEQITISGFVSDAGIKWNLSPNTYMFRDVVVNDLDAKN